MKISGSKVVLLGACSMTIAGLSGCGVAQKVVDETQEAYASVAAFESGAELSHIAGVYGDSIREVTAETEEEYLEAASTSIYAALQDAFAGCVTATPDDDNPSTVGATFNCSGTQGMFEITGTIQGTLTPVVQNMRVVGSRLELSTTDLEVSGRPVAGTAEVLYTISSNEAALDMDFDAEDPKAGQVHVMVTGTLVPTSSCVAFEGNIHGETDAAELDVTVTDFERCEGKCPSAGGKAVVKLSDADGEGTLTISFDGTDEAQVTSTRGKSFSVNLTCGQ